MKEDIKYTSVRIYRKEGGFDLIKGSGLLFEDNGRFYVLTAFHCMQCKDVDGTLIKLDANKTEIVMMINRQEIHITIDGIVDFNEAKDWILLSVLKPEIDSALLKKIKFTTQINVGLDCDSYPYLSIMNGRPRYTPLRSINDMGDFHLIDDASSGRFTANTVMKGGSGSGILRKNESEIFCFGLMKETLEEGAFNDISSVDISDVPLLLSAEAKKRLSRLEVNQMILEDRNETLTNIKQEIESIKEDKTLEAFIGILLIKVVPNLLNLFNLDTAWAILNLAMDNISEESDHFAECNFLLAEYYNIKGETDKAREYYHIAYSLSPVEPKYIEHEIKLLHHKGDEESALKLMAQLPEDNLYRLSFSIISSPNIRNAFNSAPVEITSNPSFRNRLLELSALNKTDMTWLFDDYLPSIPQNLTVNNLPDWLFLMVYYRVKLRDYIFLSRKLPQVNNLEIINEAFYTAKRFFTLASGTPLEHGIPILRSLYCYWGYVLDGEPNWIDEFNKIDFTKAEEQESYCILLQSSIYSMLERYGEAYLCISAKNLPHESILLQYVTHLSIISGDLTFIKSYLSIHSHESITLSDILANSIAGLLTIMPATDFDLFVSDLNFENPNAKQVLIDHAHSINGTPVDVSSYPEIAMGLNGNLASYAALTMSNNGKYVDALLFLKPMLHTEFGQTVDATYRQLLSKDKSKADEYFVELKRNRKEGHAVQINDMLMEYNMSLSISDYPNALEIAESLYSIDPDNEMYLSAKIDLIGKVCPEQLPVLYHDVHTYPYKNTQFIITVYYAYAQNGYIQQALDFLYDNAIRLNDDDLLSFFDTECITGPIRSIVNQRFGVVENESYIIIEREDGSRDPINVKAETMLGQALIGHTKGDKIIVAMPDGEKTFVIIEIISKYLYLHTLHFKTIFQNGGNRHFTPIRVDSSTPEEIFRQINNIIGRDVLEDKKQKMIEGYLNGEVPLLQMVSDDDTLGDYYNYLFSNFKVKIIPYLAEKERKSQYLGNGHHYLLDCTSLLLLFEFNLLHPEIEFKHQFRISPFVEELVKSYRKNLHLLDSFPLYEAIKQGHLFHFSDNYSEDIDQRFDSLLSWIKIHCEIVQDRAVLRVSDPAQNQTSQLFVNTYIGLIDENKESNILISDDINMERMMKTILPAISTETYVYTHLGSDIGQLFSIFLCENNCLGSNVPSKYIIEEYDLFEKGIENKLMNILDPVHLSSDIKTMINACHGIISEARNIELASNTTRTLLTNLFRFANERFVSSREWLYLYIEQESTEIGKQYICPVLREIEEKVRKQ